MTEPTTSNVALIVPNTGDLVDTWGSAALNPDLIAIDGLLAGIVTVSLSNVPVTLTSPSGVIAPSSGPVQSQNAVINLTGTLTANVTVTLPLPGVQRIANYTTGLFDVTLRSATLGEVVGIPQGAVTEVFNDGTNVRFLNLGRPGSLIFETAISAVPSWISACSTLPYLVCDGSIYNYSAFPYLAERLQGKFGGNGITTFAVPDLQGRVPIAYDGTGTRITTAGCGINGQTMGAAGGVQSVTLSISQMPSHSHALTDPGHKHNTGAQSLPVQLGSTGAYVFNGSSTTFDTSVSQTGISMASAGGGALHTNVQPAQVAGIWLIKT